MPLSVMNMPTIEHQQCYCGILFFKQFRCSLLLIAVAILCVVMPLSGVCFIDATGDHSPPNSCNIVNASQCSPGESFLNASRCCQRCHACPDRMEVRTACNNTHDTHCVPTCSDPATRWSEQDGFCAINCSLCSSDSVCDPIGRRCVCNPSICYLDTLCQTRCPEPTSATSVVNSNPGNPSTLPSWGVGVIAVGAVLGIVAFSAGFLLMGVCTRKRRAEVDSEASDNSNSVLVSMDGRTSRGTHSTYIAGYPNQSLIDLLRNTNTPTHSSSSSIRSSPRSARASPLPARTVPVKGDNLHLNTSSPLHSSMSCHQSDQRSPLPVRTIQVKDTDIHLSSSEV